jgi:gluconate kinase
MSQAKRPSRSLYQKPLAAHGSRPIFVIMHITKETLSGRTLGAEEPELAERIMEQKIADIQEPLEEEKDVILIDSMRDVNTLFPEIMEGITRQLQVNM